MKQKSCPYCGHRPATDLAKHLQAAQTQCVPVAPVAAYMELTIDILPTAYQYHPSLSCADATLGLSGMDWRFADRIKGREQIVLTVTYLLDGDGEGQAVYSTRAIDEDGGYVEMTDDMRAFLTEAVRQHLGDQ